MNLNEYKWIFFSSRINFYTGLSCQGFNIRYVTYRMFYLVRGKYKAEWTGLPKNDFGIDFRNSSIRSKNMRFWHFISPSYTTKTVGTKCVGDDFGYFGHQHRLSFYVSVGHQHSKDVVNIHKSSPTSLSPQSYVPERGTYSCRLKQNFFQ